MKRGGQRGQIVGRDEARQGQEERREVSVLHLLDDPRQPAVRLDVMPGVRGVVLVLGAAEQAQRAPDGGRGAEARVLRAAIRQSGVGAR